MELPVHSEPAHSTCYIFAVHKHLASKRHYWPMALPARCPVAFDHRTINLRLPPPSPSLGTYEPSPRSRLDLRSLASICNCACNVLCDRGDAERPLPVIGSGLQQFDFGLTRTP